MLQNALEPDMEPEARRRAFLSLTDLDLAQGDAGTAIHTGRDGFQRHQNAAPR